LIGSSNIYKHYRATAFPRFKEYSMVRCVDIDSFKAQIGNLEPQETEIVISVIENFIEKAVTTTDQEKRTRELEAVVGAYLKVIEEAARKNPGSRFVVVEPILRPRLAWYDDLYENIKKSHKEIVRSMGVINVFGVDVICRASQSFEEDGIHLTKNSGFNFVEGTLEAAEAVFRASVVDLDEDEEENGAKKHGYSGLSVERRLDNLEAKIDERRWNDNLMFARTREELDTTTNKSKEDRIIMTGLTSSNPPPRDKAQRSQWIRQIVVDMIKSFKPDFDGKIGFVNQGKNNGKEIPMVEVKLGSIESAASIRKAFAEKRKEGDGKSLGRLYVANSVTLSTRVRIDVMKAIARKISKGSEAAHVAAFSSRPILHVKSIGSGDSNIRAFTFIDAIIRYGAVLVQADLDEAYRRAGSAFRGQLEQHFVVLHESGGHAKAGAGGSSSSGRGTGSGGSGGWARPGGSGESGKPASKFNPKRQREDESSKSAFKKSKN
jgi:hypothetical protein